MVKSFSISGLKLLPFFLSLILLLCLTTRGLGAKLNSNEDKKQPAFKIEVVGKGKPMILIPGLSSSGDVWKTTVEHYQNDYQCHVLTLAGFAGQPAITTPLIQTVQQELIAYIKEHKLEKPTIVGHSLGGFLALSLAAQEPNLVGSLVIVDSLPFLPASQNPNATTETAKPQAEQMRAMMGNLSVEQWKAFQQKSPILKSMVSEPANLALVTQWSADSDPKTVSNAFYEIFTTDIRESISNIKTPTLVIGTWVGTGFIPNKQATEKVFTTQYAKLSGVVIKMSDTAKHFVMLDDPKWLFQQMDEFLKPNK